MSWHDTGAFLLGRWAFGTAGFQMIPNYGTSLFDEINPLSNFNGHVIAAAQGAACLAALAAVQMSRVATQTGGLVYSIGSGLVGLLCIVMASSSSLSIAYPIYVVAIGINQLLLCLVYVQCARSLTNGQFILLFSFNTVAGLVIQSALQAIVVSRFLGRVYHFVFCELSDHLDALRNLNTWMQASLKLPIHDQFYAFGCYCLGLAVAFSIMCYYHYAKTGVMRLVSLDQDVFSPTGNLYAVGLSSD